MHYVSSTDEVLITSTVHRSQARNIDECLSQVRFCDVHAASLPIPSRLLVSRPPRVCIVLPHQERSFGRTEAKG